MRLTEFWARMTEQFGRDYADSVARDQAIASLDDRSVHQALADGVDARRVWLAVCEHFEVPVSRRH